MKQTEKEKMLSGELYNRAEAELTAERFRAKEFILRFNTLHPVEKENRNELINQLFGSARSNIFIEPPFRCDYGYNIYAGVVAAGNPCCVIRRITEFDKQESMVGEK